MPVRRFLTAVAAVLVLLLAAPGAALAGRSVPFAFFGVNWDKEIACCATPSTQFSQWDRLTVVGAESTRTNFNWAAAQPHATDSFDFTASDWIMTLAAAHKTTVLPVVMGAPAWARHKIKSPPCKVSGTNAPPTHTGPYTRYLRALVRRYGPNGSFWADNPALNATPIHDWQIWNEPSECYQWTIPKGTDWAPGYAKLLKASYRSVKQVDPNGHVVLAGLPNYSWKSLDHLYKAGHVHGYFDAAAVHPYTGAKHGPLIIAQRFRKVMNKHHDSKKPLLVTETALPASQGKTSPGPFQTTNLGMASFLKQTYRDFMKNRKKLHIGRVYWYTWASDYSGWYFDFTGLVRYRRYPDHEDVHEKPALSEYQTLARRAEGCTKDKFGSCRPGS